MFTLAGGVFLGVLGVVIVNEVYEYFKKKYAKKVG